MEHCLFEQSDVPLNGRFHSHLLHAHAGGTCGCAGHGQVAHNGHVYAVSVDVAGHLNSAAIRQIGDMAGVDHVKVAAVDTTRFKRFDDVRIMFRAALIVGDLGRLFGKPLGKICFKP